MKVALINIGNELLSGVTVNTNASWMGQQLMEIGHPVQTIYTIGDSRNEILSALNDLWKNYPIILITGGLGPTHDDITVAAMAKFFDTELVFHQPTFDALKERLESRDIPISERHEAQAMLPRNAEVLINNAGTAPALYFCENDKHVYCLPGVPHEMRRLMREHILPQLERLSPVRFQRTLLRTIGYPESKLYDTVKHIVESLPAGYVAFLPQIYGVDIRLQTDDTKKENREHLREVLEKIKARLGNAIYAEKDIPLAQAVGNLLREQNATLATAESCTGGLMGDMITDISGSSDYFFQGFVTYSNQAKIDTLGVPENLIKKHGAVSEDVARSMATGAMEKSEVHTALSTTGIAGPTGGTADKPVGLVYIGCVVGDKIQVKRYQFSDDRRLNKQRTVYAALNLLRLELFAEQK
ncbi:MAG: Nicotinamide-nucleotide amidohydrolase PncC [Candidatus Marinimicrobia bacterium]|nr:Nicotinamide-nucleotide amidohydrolase PncC [Candidatus Neomarinimicrobiota bacterium]